MTSQVKRLSLRKAFENVKKAAVIASRAQEEFNHALADSKYNVLEGELPDHIVDVTDYGTADMTWEEFKQDMDEALQDYKDSNRE